MIVNYGVIDNVLNDLINFFRPLAQISLRKKLRQNDRPHAGNKSFSAFDVNIYLAGQTKADFNILIQKLIGKLCAAKLNNLKWFSR